jgi:hypothetical protein
MPVNEKKATASRHVATPPFLILRTGEIDAKENNPDVRYGFDTTIILYAGQQT